MRIGMVGLDALYWPVAIGNGLINKAGVEYLGAATLDVSEGEIKARLGISPTEYAQKYHVKLYCQAEEMIEKERLEAVAIISRHSQHANWVERLASTGVKMFIPKTFTTTMADADRICKIQRRFGNLIAVGPSARFLLPFVAAKQALEQGLIGEPFSLRICHHHGTIDVFNASDWYRDPEEGGPELSLGWYGIDLALHLMGDRARSVYAEYANFTSPDSPFMDCGKIVLRLERGGIVSFDMYFCNRVAYPSWQVEIVGPKGVISIHRVENDSSKTVVSLDGPGGRSALPVPAQAPHWETFWVDDFVHNRESVITAKDAREITRISLAARDSSRGKGLVTL